MDAAPQVKDMRVKAMSQAPGRSPQASAFCTSRGRGPALGLHGRALGPELPLGRRADLPPLPGDAGLPPGRSGRNLPAFLHARRVREPESGASL